MEVEDGSLVQPWVVAQCARTARHNGPTMRVIEDQVNDIAAAAVIPCHLTGSFRPTTQSCGPYVALSDGWVGWWPRRGVSRARSTVIMATCPVRRTRRRVGETFG
jgi:hypothetical protein